MKTIFFVLGMIYGLMATIPPNFGQMKEIEKNGMKICWQFNHNKLDVKVFAPTKGWVAIGFNEENHLVGNNLIMGKIVDGQAIVSDRRIVGFGNHKAVEDIGGKNHLSNIGGKEDANGSLLQFSLTIESMDDFHYDLSKEKTLFLLIAYSESDDFEHHSRMRTSVEIRL